MICIRFIFCTLLANIIKHMKLYIYFFFLGAILIFTSDMALIANNQTYLHNLTHHSFFNQVFHIPNNKSTGTKLVADLRKKQNIINNTIDNINVTAKTEKLDSAQNNKIVKIWEVNEGVLNIAVALSDTQSVIKIAVYNMLGKEIKKIFTGLPTNKNEDGNYIFSSETALNVPKGVYIIVVQGAQFRIAEKYIFTK